jgi:hypothetical protein
MAIGLGIFLIAIGAIFRFGITVNLSSIDFHAIGLIIMLAGTALLAIDIFLIARAAVAPERRNITDRGSADRDLTSGYRDPTRDLTRDDDRPPYYLGPPSGPRR